MSWLPIPGDFEKHLVENVVEGPTLWRGGDQDIEVRWRAPHKILYITKMKSPAGWNPSRLSPPGGTIVGSGGLVWWRGSANDLCMYVNQARRGPDRNLESNIIRSAAILPGHSPKKLDVALRTLSKPLFQKWVDVSKLLQRLFGG